MDRIIQLVLPLCISMDGSPKSRRALWLWAAVLLIAGALLWGKFLNWGLGPYQYHDWADITIPRLTLVRDAVREGVLPLHIRDGFPLGGVTDRYLTIPDAFLSPQVILFRWLDLGPFILVNFLLLYAVGFAGLLWLAFKKHFSPLAFTFLFLLFNFNGHMLAHISIGHYTWISYFLFPWLIVLVFDLLEGSGGWAWILKLCILLYVLLLQGGYHQFVWTLLLLALLIPVAPRHTVTLIRALVFSVLVSLARTLPPVLNLGVFDNKYVGGYPFLHTIWFALVRVYSPNDFTNNLFLTNQIGTWEYALYIGIPAVVVLAVFGGVIMFRNRQRTGSYAGLLLPVIGLTLLSLNDIYQALRDVLPLPVFTGERVSARIISLAFVLLLVLAVIEIQQWLNLQKASPVFVLTSAGVVLMIANDLWQNFHLWRIPAAALKFNLAPEDLARWTVTNHPDPAYTNLLLIGSAITVLAFLALVILARREARKAAQPPQG